jgi:sugar phosphate isomerase/epimerase
MKISQVAAQLFTIRAHTKTPADVAVSMKKIRDIGYEAVQVSGMGPIPEEELMRILDGEGLTCCATHEGADTILNEPERVVERLQKLNCKITAYPYPSGVSFDTHENVKALCDKLDEAGKVLHEAGLVLCYHNHHLEFRRIGDTPALDMIYAETDPRYLQGEIDTYWVQYGGGDPVWYCQSLKDRLPIVHLKDYMIDDESNVTMCEIGNGNLNFPGIIEACEASGCEWYAVEQDRCPEDPFDSLRQSFEYIKAELAEQE